MRGFFLFGLFLRMFFFCTFFCIFYFCIIYFCIFFFCNLFCRFGRVHREASPLGGGRFRHDCGRGLSFLCRTIGESLFREGGGEVQVVDKLLDVLLVARYGIADTLAGSDARGRLVEDDLQAIGQFVPGGVVFLAGIDGVADIHHVVGRRHLVRGEALTDQGDEIRIERAGLFLCVQYPDLHRDDVRIGVARAFQLRQEAEARQEAVELHVVVVEVGVHREANVGRDDGAASFRRHLEGGDIVGRQAGDVRTVAARGADSRHAGLDKGFLAVVARVDHGRAVIVHPDVPQQVVALGTPQLPAEVVRVLRRYVGAAEVVDDLFALDVRAVAVRTVLYI